MTGLPWVRLDAAFPRNHKVLALLGGRGGHKALCVYVFGLAYCGEQGTDGFIPREALPLMHGNPAAARALVDARLWLEQPGGWRVNDWSNYQPSSAEAAERSKRAQAAALARHHRARGP